ncbi:MAG: lysozyme inhibitor LprI family protein [Spirosomataceae bacterium]
MKTIFSIGILCLGLLFSHVSLGQTQAEINQNAYNDYLRADKQLNTVYTAVLKKYKSDLVFVKNLRNAQRIWIQFRDAEMLAKYPERPVGQYGSIQPMCWHIYLQELTEERTAKLKLWLSGTVEGDVCAGSVLVN